MKKLIGAVVLTAGLGVLVVTATALATEGSGIETEVLSVGRFEAIDVETTEAPPHQVSLKTEDLSDVYVVENTVEPGGHSGWHTHPGPSLITVVEGTATFYDGDDPTCTARVYPAGTGVIDPGDGHVHLLRNEGDVDLVTLTVQLLPADADRRIDAPDPGNCAF